MEPGGSMLHHKGSKIIPILSRINPIPRINTYFFMIHSNIVLPSISSFPNDLCLTVNLTNSTTYGTRRFNASLTRARQ